jgi:hypothetical protein
MDSGGSLKRREVPDNTRHGRYGGENSKMMNPLSSERPSAGAVMAFDGQTENTFSRRNLCVSR